MPTTTTIFGLLFAITAAAGVPSAMAMAVIAVPNADRVEVEGHRWYNLLAAQPRGNHQQRSNPFGTAYNATPTWSALCPLDSDGDGFTNGEELGDPNCVWTQGAVPARTTMLSHPGLYGSVPSEAYPSRTRAAVTCVRDSAATPSMEPSDDRVSQRTTFSVPTIDRLTVFSRVVTVRKADADADNLLPAQEDRTTCPHKASGLSDWHDPSTWAGAGVPAAGSAVTIPAGKRVLVSSCSLEPAGYAKITIPAGTALIFADAPIFLRTKDIVVQGELLLGSTRCPLHSAISITFIGEKSELATFSNGIAASGSGAMRLHGTRNQWTWTRLAATIVPGTTFVLVQDAVGWGPGDEIIVTTSIWKDLENDQNEVRTVVAVSNDGKTLIVDKAFSFKHYAGIEYQTEVGLLTRSILLRGSPSAQATTDKFGGHTMAMGESAVTEVIGVRAQRMGQQNVLARYPFHMHLLRESGPSSTVQQSTCDRCWYRCVSVHKTNRTIVRKNVAYNVSGHTFYLEDGGEMFNRIEYNMAAYILPLGRPASGGAQSGEEFDEDSDAIQPADHTASGFYISNPHNYVIGNAASGGWSGFSYPIFPYAQRLSADLNINPSKYPVLECDGNTAHSSGHYWGDAGCIYFGGKLTDNAARTLFTYSNGRFSHPTNGLHNITNLRTWLCQKGFSSWGERVELDRFEAHDVKRSAVLFGSSSIHNAIITGMTENNSPDLRSSGRQGFGFYDTWVQTVLANVTFVNYWPRSTTSVWERDGVIADLTHSDIFKPWGISATRDLTLTNVDTTRTLSRWVRESGASRMFNIADWDGSLLGTRTCAPHIIGSEIDWWNVGSDCYYRSDWPAYVCPRVPGREVVGLDMDLPGIMQQLDERTDSNNELTQAQRDRLYIGHISQWGSKSDRKLIITRNNHLATGLSGIGWYMYLSTGVPQVIKITPKNFPTNGVYIALAISYPADTTFDIWAVPRWNSYKTRFTQVLTRDQVIAGNGTSYAFVASEGLLYLKLGDWWSPYPNSYRRFGVDIYDVMDSEVQIVVNATCLSRNGAGFCAAPATPNPPTADGLLPVRVCNNATEQTTKQKPKDLCPTYNDTLRPDLAATYADCDAYIGTSTWRCPGLVSAGYCNATCAAACRVYNPYPYRCSFAEPCQTREFQTPPQGGQCSALVSSPQTLLKDECFMKACISGRLYQVRATAGTPCAGEVDKGTGSQWRCSGAGSCVNASFYAAGAPSVRRVSDRAPASDPRLVEVLVDTGSSTAVISAVTVTLHNTPTSAPSTFTMTVQQGTSSNALKLYQYTHTQPVRRNVSVVLTLAGGGQAQTFTFLDWARSAQVVPQITPTASGISVNPIDWVTRAVFYASSSAATGTDLTCDYGSAAACTASDANLFTAAAVDAYVMLHLANNITIRRPLPCLSATHVSSACQTAAVTVRRPHISCQFSFSFSGNKWWYSLNLLEGNFSNIAAITAPGNKILNRGSTSYSGSSNGQTTPATILVTLLDGRNESYILERPAEAVSGDELTCGGGFGPPPGPPEAGQAGICTALRMCVPDGVVASPPPPPPADPASTSTATATAGGGNNTSPSASSTSTTPSPRTVNGTTLGFSGTAARTTGVALVLSIVGAVVACMI